MAFIEWTDPPWLGDYEFQRTELNRHPDDYLNYLRDHQGEDEGDEEE